jgi:4-hydroxy-2-oxoheptanedioate aldolase
MNTIQIIGLGAGGEDDLTLRANKALSEKIPTFVRTDRHPLVDHLRKSIDIVSFDEYFEKYETFDQVYEAILHTLIEEAKKHGKINYCTAGSPHYGDIVTKKLINEYKGQINTIIIDGMSFLDKCIKLSPFARIKEVSRAAVLRMLDIGAEGLIVPYVKTVDEVKALVKYGKYAPVGERGFFYGRAAGYGFEDFAKNLDEYTDKCNYETMIIPQCETSGCLENIEEIASIDGVDGIFVGPYDLSIALGIPGQFNSDILINALDRIVKACKKAGKFTFIFANDTESASKNFEMGFDSVAISTDIAVLVNAYRNIVKTIK